MTPGGIKCAPESASLQITRTIAVAMFAYSNDNNGDYPDGNSSTEVFQKLLDGGYVSDPSTFYLPMSGKVKPIPGQKLKPENVCWDVTGNVDANSPDMLPIVFLTGYMVQYVPGGSAVPLSNRSPRYGWVDPIQNWWDRLMGRPTILWFDRPGIAVAYKSNAAKFMISNPSTNPDGSIPYFISPDFKPDGVTYRQLTPDGPLR